MSSNFRDRPTAALTHAKTTLLTTLLLAGVGQTDMTHAASVNTGDILTISSVIFSGDIVMGGSYFMIDYDGSYTFELTERTGIRQGASGLIIGISQPGGWSHSGLPYGTPTPDNSEGGAIDAAWGFLNNTGMHFTASPVTGSTTAGLDFSGWRWTWNGIPSIPWGGGVQDCGTAADGICMNGTTDVAGTINNGTGIATFSWNGVYGSGYTLDYFAIAPLDDSSGFGGVPYGLHLEGTVGAVPAVPVPVAAWLFGSGLAGLLVMARRRMS